MSFLSLLNGKNELKRDTLYWHYPHYHRTMPYGAIREKNWKLIEFYEEGGLELYDLANDPHEKNNLATKNPEKAQELLSKFKAWKKSVAAQAMTPNPNHDPNRVKGRAKKPKKKKTTK